MNPLDIKRTLLETLSRIFQETAQSPRRQGHGRMVKSNAPREPKERKARSAKPRKPAPNGRVELVAKQKKARP